MGGDQGGPGGHVDGAQLTAGGLWPATGTSGTASPSRMATSQMQRGPATTAQAAQWLSPEHLSRTSTQKWQSGHRATSGRGNQGVQTTLLWDTLPAVSSGSPSTGAAMPPLQQAPALLLQATRTLYLCLASSEEQTCLEAAGLTETKKCIL